MGYALIRVGKYDGNKYYLSEGGTFIRDRYNFLVLFSRQIVTILRIVLLVKPNISEFS